MRLFVLLLLSCLVVSCSAWEWTDYLGDAGDVSFQTETLTMGQVRELRVREIKRLLARTHGYSADELGRMLDKKELIQALSFEEHKEREKEQGKLKRFLVIRGIIGTLIAVVVVMGWPVWKSLYETASVNFVVYTDRKRHEASRCMELQSFEGMFGVFLMGIFDMLSLWLSVSVFLSWFTSSRYFFPMPSLPVRPAQFMGGKVASGPMAKYGINVGPMAVTWVLRFISGRLERFTGRALARAYQRQKKATREWESPEDRAARKAARKAAKKLAREQAEAKRLEVELEEGRRRKEAADKATAEMFPPTSGVAPPPPPNTAREESRKEFQEQMENFDMDDLD
jgi:hypothetical protein